MRTKIIFLLTVAVLLTVLLMQNNQKAKFNILFFSDVAVSKLSVFLVVTIASFVAGIVIARPNKRRTVGTDFEDDEDDEHPNTKSNTLSDEDRDYLH